MGVSSKGFCWPRSLHFVWPNSGRVFPVIPAQATVSQLAKRQLLLICHSGLDPESISVSGGYVCGCRSKIPCLAGIKSGMTGFE
jgi:hypothetical protein